MLGQLLHRFRIAGTPSTRMWPRRSRCFRWSQPCERTLALNFPASDIVAHDIFTLTQLMRFFHNSFSGEHAVDSIKISTNSFIVDSRLSILWGSGVTRENAESQSTERTDLISRTTEEMIGKALDLNHDCMFTRGPRLGSGTGSALIKPSSILSSRITQPLHSFGTLNSVDSTGFHYGLPHIEPNSSEFSFQRR